MSYSLKLQGSLTASSGNAPNSPELSYALDEALTVKAFQTYEMVLNADPAQAVALAGVANIHYLYVKTVGGKVRVRVTSADGSQQSIPVDDHLILQASAVPSTAVDFTRVSGAVTTVRGLVAEKA